MRVQDEQAWSEQLAEFSVDEMSRKFRDFLVKWVETAESLLLNSSEQDLSPREALSKAFVIAEQILGYLSVEWLSQMLLVVVQHWVYGPGVWESLSVWEQRMVHQATALKLVELQESAKMTLEDSHSPDVEDFPAF